MTTKDPSLAILQEFDYTYDNVGNRLTENRAQAADFRSYTYDPTYQLTQATSTLNPLPESFTYDRLGNRLSTTQNATTTTYLANRLNQYTQVGPVTPTYDSNGNLTYDGTHALTYDSENRLIQAQKAGMTAQYQYDHAGPRILKNVNGTSTYFLYDGEQIIAEYDQFGNLSAKYIFGVGVDEPLVMVRSGQKYYYHVDGLGNITVISNVTGNLTERYEYNSFGQVTIRNGSGTIIPTSSINNRYMFTGREYDFETGLYHYRARAYNPLLGRFIQTDPVGYDAGDLNLYRYVGNNPVNFVDPYGKWADPTSWPFPGTNYCGISRRGPGSATSPVDSCCQAHDECVTGTGDDWWDITNEDIRGCHGDLIGCWRGTRKK